MVIIISTVRLGFARLVKKIAPDAPPLISGGDRPLKMTFEDQLNALIFHHLEEHVSARHLKS